MDAKHSSPFDLTGRVAVVTGASSGIGQAIAIALARAGADIAGLSLDEAGATTEAVAAEGRRSLQLVGDVASREQVDELGTATLEAFGRLDVWFNNAARLLRPAVLRDNRGRLAVAARLEPARLRLGVPRRRPRDGGQGRPDRQRDLRG